MAFVLCLHNFSCKKIKLDIYSVGFIAIQLTFLQMMQNRIVSNEMYFAAYLICFIYAYIKFKDNIKKTMLKCLMTMVIIVLLEMIIYIPMSFLYYIIPKENVIIVLINAIMLLVLFLSKNSRRYIIALEFCESKDWILRICLLLCGAIMVYCMFSLKKSEVIQMDIFLLISLFMVILSIFLFRWQKSTYEVETKKRELQITNMYNDVFEELIETTRRKQHDFHNHIDAIYGLHITAKSFEELVEAQKEYCEKLVYDNRFVKVLSCVNNSTLAGFLYTKFIGAEQCGIEVEYNLTYKESEKVSVYDLIEIIGIFIDNAIDALKESTLPKKIIFELKDYSGLELSVSNPVDGITNNDIEKFFLNGYTTKSDGRGIGLNKIKEYQRKYKFDIFTQLKEKDQNKWIEFKIVEKP